MITDLINDQCATDTKPPMEITQAPERPLEPPVEKIDPVEIQLKIEELQCELFDMDRVETTTKDDLDIAYVRKPRPYRMIEMYKGMIEEIESSIKAIKNEIDDLTDKL